MKSSVLFSFVSVFIMLLHLLGGSVVQADDQVDGYISLTPEFHFPSGNAGSSIWKYEQYSNYYNWHLPSFDDAGWPEGQAGFGQNALPGDQLGTWWDTTHLYLRRWFDLTAEQIADLVFYCRHDDSMEIYINGVLAVDRDEWSSRYRYLAIAPEAMATLQPGPNLVAVHVQDFGGDQYCDVGLCRNPLATIPQAGWSSTPQVGQLAATVHQFMKENLIPAGTMAVMKGDQIVANHSFGYLDRDLTQPVPETTVLRLASNDKVITAGLIQKLVSEGAQDPVTGQTLTTDLLVFPYLASRGVTQPDGSQPDDSRILTVTIQHLLDHNSHVYELPSADDLAQIWGLPKEQIEDRHNAGYVSSRRPYYFPGSGYRYSSSGYFLLRYIAQLFTGDVEAYLQNELFPAGEQAAIYVSRERAGDRLPNEPWYCTFQSPTDARWIYLDEFYALGATAEAMVRYLRHFNLSTGDSMYNPVTGEWWAYPDNGLGVFYGAMSGTWSVSIQRRWDEVSIAVIFNQVDVYDALTDQLLGLVDAMAEDDWFPVSGVALDVEQENGLPPLKLFPNPSSGSTLIALTPRTTGTVTFEVFNLRGQRVRRYRTEAGAGSAVMWEWDGKDSMQASMPSGIYFIRTSSGGRDWTCKLVLHR
jgi:CubicO group peptidase (beta-lactamase class C family)